MAVHNFDEIKLKLDSIELMSKWLMFLKHIE